MAEVNRYSQLLGRYLTEPGSFEGSPGYKFALDTGLESVKRSSSASRGSGGTLAALLKYGQGLASQERGNEIDRVQRALGGEQQYDLGTEQNRLTGVRDANAFALGTEQNANTRSANDQQFGLGLYRAGNDFALGREQNAGASEGRWLEYDIARRRDALDNANAENTYNYNTDRLGLDWYGADTQRGDARSRSYYAGEANRRAWKPYGGY